MVAVTSSRLPSRMTRSPKIRLTYPCLNAANCVAAFTPHGRYISHSSAPPAACSDCTTIGGAACHTAGMFHILLFLSAMCGFVRKSCQAFRPFCLEMSPVRSNLSLSLLMSSGEYREYIRALLDSLLAALSSMALPGDLDSGPVE